MPLRLELQAARCLAYSTVSKIKCAFSKEECDIPVSCGHALSERALSAELASAFARLPTREDGRPELKSEAGRFACFTFLAQLSNLAENLHCECADRTYRRDFATNYQILFPDQTRSYRTDVLEASLYALHTFWVNGTCFHLSADMLALGRKLAQSWDELSDFLHSWHSQAGSSGQQCVDALVRLLNTLDIDWAAFEHKYVIELSMIEESARGILVSAVHLEYNLWQAEQTRGKDSLLCVEPRRQLVQFLCKLNSVANSKRKGRDDLRPEVLETALDLLARAPRRKDAAYVLASEVRDTFEKLRQYLQSVKRSIHCVNPHLRRNKELVDRLTAWEEAWEVGAAYLPRAPLREALCSSVARLRIAQVSDSDFGSMVASCDAELFMVLPRLLWLNFLHRPSEHAELIRKVLPIAFVEARPTTPGGETVGVPDEELCRFMTEYRAVRRAIGSKLQQWSPEARPEAAFADAAHVVLRRRAVVGTSCSEADGECWQDAQTTELIEVFMRRLEVWSLQLQRHCPNDWNDCSEVLLHCLEGEPPRP